MTRPVPSEILDHGKQVIDAVLRLAEAVDPQIVRPIANRLAEFCLERAGAGRTGSGRVTVPVVVYQTPKPPKPDG